MRGGLELAQPKRRWRWGVGIVAVLLLLGSVPWLAAAFPAGWSYLDRLLASHVAPRYEERLADLTEQNAALHHQLATAEAALAENEALRRLLDSQRVTGSWQPARVVARQPNSATLACTAEEGAAVVDPQGRYVGRVVENRPDDTCRIAFAGTEESPCAGLSGDFSGLLARHGGWVLTGLPADCGLPAGTVVTTPGGYWLGALAETPQPDGDGLTASAALQDTADQNSLVFFVKK